MFEALRRDCERYATLGGWYRNLGFWVGATYRFGAWARGLPRPFGFPLRVLHATLRLPWVVLLHVKLDAERIGPGFILIHPHCVLMAAGTVIRRDCLIFHEVTLGTNVEAHGAPVIGDGVDLYVGARVLGPVTIGDGSIVGANCVVTQDVGPGSVVAPSAVRAARRQTVASVGSSGS